tara:strand:+ start:5843 stop:6169 length:327 start_codon:yes stop_codon:yes gene_type:complete
MSNTEITYRPKYKTPERELNFEERLLQINNRVEELERVIKTDPVMNKPYDRDDLLSLKEIRRRTGFSYQVLKKEINNDRLKGVVFGDRMYFKESNFHEWLDNRENKNK